MKLPAGFSPKQALSQIGDWMGVYGNNSQGADYDVFNEMSFGGGARDPLPGTGGIWGGAQGQVNPGWTASSSGGYVPTTNKQNSGNNNNSANNNTTTTTTNNSNNKTSYDPAELAWLDSQISNTRGQYGLIDDALNRGIQDLQNSYQGAVNDANKQRERAIEGYQIQRDTTERGKTNALSRVDDNARQLLNSLRRRIAQAGGANSSAYLQEAPGMVAEQAGSNRGDVMENYGTNFMNLARAERYAEDDYNDLLGQIARDRDQRQRDLRVGVDQQRQNLDLDLAKMAGQRSQLMGGKLADVRSAMQPYLDQSNQRENAIRDIYNQYSKVTAPRALNVQKVNLRDYMVDRATQLANEQAGTQDDPNAYYRPRTREEDDERKLIV